jgi:hypothetical protein
VNINLKWCRRAKQKHCIVISNVSYTMVNTSASQIGFQETKMCNGGRVLLTILSLYLQIKLRVAAFDTNHSVTDSTKFVVASVQKLPDSVVKSAELAIDRVIMSGETTRL